MLVRAGFSRHTVVSVMLVASTMLLPAAVARANPPCNVPQTANVLLDGPLVCNGTNGIVVGASGITIDLHGFEVSGDGTLGTAGVVDSGGFDNVKIQNGKIRGFHGGIEIFNDSDKVTVRDVEIRGTAGDGILVFGGSDQLTIKNASVVAAGNLGINIGDAIGVKLDGVECTKNLVGIHLGSVTAAKLTNVVSSLASDGSNGQGLVLDGTSTGTVIAKSSFTQNARVGILLQGPAVTGTVLKDVTVSGNVLDGLAIDDADGSVIKKLTAAGNGTTAISIFDHADATTVSQSLIVGNGSYGIYVSPDSSGAILSKLVVTGNKGSGIETNIGDTLIASTIARANGDYGIFAAPGNHDGGGNKARGNAAPSQCAGVVCR